MMVGPRIQVPFGIAGLRRAVGAASCLIDGTCPGFEAAAAIDACQTQRRKYLPRRSIDQRGWSARRRRARHVQRRRRASPEPKQLHAAAARGLSRRERLVRVSPLLRGAETGDGHFDLVAMALEIAYLISDLLRFQP